MNFPVDLKRLNSFHLVLNWDDHMYITYETKGYDLIIYWKYLLNSNLQVLVQKHSISVMKAMKNVVR